MNNTTSLCFIALGSNLNSPLQQVQSAVKELAQHEDITLIQRSSWYLSKPLGPQDQPDFINGVISMTTELTPLALLDTLQTLEHAHGRARKQHWGPRTLDLDLLLYGRQIEQCERLILPHPQMLRRNFVLLPLYEIAPKLVLPGGTALEKFIDSSLNTNIEKLQQY
ncbi:2-amino-4-hydroxy-6-hydroxymethyldihydropteridine pyrophosphokinase [Piscirickettsia salmonis]|uniref:2-amino-4-hydroxy-6- hydroxymethyldihydropteridine diphosphokinase n=1 Tax=Piscirickettsia salmonis TaxID=1238 RepID=UPI0012B7D80D|nr:2-amino-4-hydroxy-6-hydroxymethyldihydropteridine diphosphokinase [Piscirickettsia salmonis]QGP51783.1 2-amino-4-hydroxy-6-hydroxymethyldihydropteridine pyrophosphokinase [Piscirickettsia salmonis]QGP52974.1 2-amino-4-hydroxy-6-hydroxymethyldihydropteridine pyrophosphokinase [Piscirickettsia salmonis]QGP61095.1 2-amino-4-hydroxy-6-hydroxymethyldihydropteridine pyrophosphokinase [Piscirickettsia salmonis]QGP62546.1 2-amino-4-hydroxy-6-hydroxymethyldihydropteridine pyrophosphokinase [Piscirick